MRAHQQGSVAIIAAAGILLILGMVGLAVDLGHLYVVKSELRRAAEAGARAGVRALFPYPLDSAIMPLTPNCSAALSKGRAICQANLVEREVPAVANLETGSWDWSTCNFSCGCSTSPFTNAVTLTVRREGIPLTVMGAFGLGPVTLQAGATAVMDWVGKVEQGYASVLVIGKKYVQTGDMYIYLNPAPVDGGGWYTKAPTVTDNSTVKSYLDNPGAVPGLKQGDVVNINNGDWGDVLQIIKSSWINKTVWVPIVDTTTFNQSGPVIGFTSVTIREVGTQGGNKYIKVTANPIREVPESEAGPGGANFGLLGAPRVVQ